MNNWSATIEPTHVAWADETHYNKGRYRAVALVSMPYCQTFVLQQQLRQLLNESNITEFKWQKLNNAQYGRAAEQMARLAIEKAVAGLLRVDVLIWDTEDFRHKRPGRDDKANLQAMYQFLFRNVLQWRWPPESTWCLYPDEQTLVKWDRLEYYLDVLKIMSCKSEIEVMIQIADLFAGLGVFSYMHYDNYNAWLKKHDKEADDIYVRKLTHSETIRFPLLHYFDNLCKHHKLTVSLRSSQGLHTRTPSKPINFWPYTPQHDEDKAPLRRKK